MSSTQGKLPVVFGYSFSAPQEILGDAEIDAESGEIYIRLNDYSKPFADLVAQELDIIAVSFILKPGNPAQPPKETNEC